MFRMKYFWTRSINGQNLKMMMRGKFNFSQKSESNQGESEKKQNLEKVNLQKNLKSDPRKFFWSQYRDNLIQVIKESEPQKPKGSEEYRIAILFEDILRKQKLIDIYDTKGRVFWFNYLLEAFLIFNGIVVGHHFIKQYLNKKHKNDLLKFLICVFFLLTRQKHGYILYIEFLIYIRLHLYRRFQKPHVEKIIFNTTTKNFELTQRSLFGLRYYTTVQKENILYTSDKFLNNRNINYMDVETLKCYQIGYNYAWKNKDLFTHLLKQNIQNIRQ